MAITLLLPELSPRPALGFSVRVGTAWLTPAKLLLCPLGRGPRKARADRDNLTKREAWVTRSAFTSRLKWRGNTACWSASFAATCGSEYSPEPTPGHQLCADALLPVPSGLLPRRVSTRFGPTGGLAMW